ncbi:hypothetical protein ABGB07_32095 [Micromonosporaceae bacterium B7E4]
MKATVVTSDAEPPRYTDFPEPHPTGEHHLVVDVLAAGLHPRVRMQPAGSHYTSCRTCTPSVGAWNGTRDAVNAALTLPHSNGPPKASTPRPNAHELRHERIRDQAERGAGRVASRSYGS